MNRLIAFLLIAAAPIFGHAGNSPFTPEGMRPYNYGAEWIAWSDEVRDIYIIGFNEGTRHTYREAEFHLPVDARDTVLAQIAMVYQIAQLRDVMTNLYRDPANTFINYGAMVYMSRDKLNGVDIENALREARRSKRGFVTK